jgi:hypothetical protein
MGIHITIDIPYWVGVTERVRWMLMEYIAHGYNDVSVSFHDCRGGYVLVWYAIRMQGIA